MGKKAYLLLGLLLVLLAAAGVSLGRASTQGEYVAAAGAQSLYRLQVAKGRGTIYDRNGQPLVGTTRELLGAVAPTLESIGALETATHGAFRSRLALALEDGKPFVLTLPTLVEHPCVDLFTVPRRYGEDQLAPHLIGYLDSQGRGAAGVELAMDDLLQAQGGEIAVTYQVDALGRVIAGGERLVEDTLGESQAGVVLTLDGELQRLAEEAAADLGQGAVVITQVPDCEILALASVPDFHPDRVGEAVDREDSPLVNRAFSAYAPGSVFKLVVAAALLEQGRPVESFPCTGSVNVNGLTFSCAGGQAHGEVNLEQALAQSCNGYFINAARSLGGQAILTMAYNLGLGEEVEFGRGLRSGAGQLPSLSSLENPRALGNFAFGQGELTATPLQLCALVNAVASEGVYATPKLLLGEVEADGRTKELSPVSDREVQAMSSATARTLQRAMEAAAQEGTGRDGAPDNCVAGIKTGTAQTGAYQGERELMHHWYCGYVEGKTGPAYCVAVFREGVAEDGGVTAQVFQTLAQALGERLS